MTVSNPTSVNHPTKSNIPERLTPPTTAAKPSKRHNFDHSNCGVTFQPMRSQPPPNVSFSQSFITSTSQSKTQQSRSPEHRKFPMNASAFPFVPIQNPGCSNTQNFQDLYYPTLTANARSRKSPISSGNYF